jgi:hypothetical protein
VTPGAVGEQVPVAEPIHDQEDDVLGLLDFCCRKRDQGRVPGRAAAGLGERGDQIDESTA